MRKVLVISHTYVTPMNQRKLQAMARHDLKIYLMTPTVVKDTLREIKLEVLKNAQFKVFPVRSYFGWHNSLRVYNSSDVRNALSEIRPDFILVEQEPYSLSTYQVMREKKRFGFKTLLFTFQNIFKKYPLPFSLIESKNLELSDVLIVGNDDARSVWQKKGMAKNKIEVLPQVGIDFDEFFAKDKVEAKAQFGIDGFVVGYAGRFVEEKGLSVLLEAMSYVKDLPISLALAGRGPYKTQLEAEIKNHGLRNVVFVDGLVHEQMSDFMNALDIFVLPSLARRHWREQFGHVLIEAMACGVPCIGSESDPIDIVIGDGGLTFKMGDAQDLATKIRLIHQSPDELQRLSQQAVKRVRENYTNDAIAKNLETIIKRLDNK